MKSLGKHINYLARVIPAYLFRHNSQLAFWHEEPKMSDDFCRDKIGAYYMDFIQKAHYDVHLDLEGIPLLDYKGSIGKQYNPIAIAQFGLGNYNLFIRTNEEKYKRNFLKAADWLVKNLEQNKQGVWVWMHCFDWEYQETLKNPWYSGLAQGQGISLLARAFSITQNDKYQDAMFNAYGDFEKDATQGGVMYWDEKGFPWIEEYIVSKPTHILNGFIWALWGIHDYYLMTHKDEVKVFWNQCLKTVEINLERYDVGYWSLYDLSPTKIKNRTSLFYHKLHVVQLKILYQLSGVDVFIDYNNRWNRYLNNAVNRWRAFCDKVIFKLYYF